jgi:hypothetical protein
MRRKNFLTALFLFFITTCVFGQSVKEFYEYNDYIKNHNISKVEIFTFLNSGEELKDTLSTEILEFDINGNFVKSNKAHKNSNSLVINYYDSLNRKISSYNETSYEVSTEIIKYDNDKRYVYNKSWQPNFPNADTALIACIYEYSTISTNEIKEVISCGEKSDSSIFTYDSIGRVIKMSYFDNGVMRFAKNYLYEENKLISVETIFDKKLSLAFGKVENKYFYNEDNMVEKIIHFENNKPLRTQIVKYFKF